VPVMISVFLQAIVSVGLRGLTNLHCSYCQLEEEPT
jgi:hypothetical protein